MESVMLFEHMKRTWKAYEKNMKIKIISGHPFPSLPFLALGDITTSSEEQINGPMKTVLGFPSKHFKVQWIYFSVTFLRHMFPVFYFFFSFSKNLLIEHIYRHYPNTQGTKMCFSDYRFPFQSHMQDPVTLGTGKEEQNSN